VRIERIDTGEETKSLQKIIYRHLEITNSPRAREVLMNWHEHHPMFWKVSPLQSPVVAHAPEPERLEPEQANPNLAVPTS
jgi:glutamate synthase domain-containing protein 3